MNVRTRRGLAVAALSLAVAAGTAPAIAAEPASPTTPETGTPVYQDPSKSTKQRVKDLLKRMTVEEKVGQMAQAERLDIDADPSLITEYGLGSVLSGGGSVPEPNTPEAWADMIDGYQEAALDTRLGIPLIYGVDAVHGHNNVVGATVFPHNIGLGASRDVDLAKEIAHITAEETRATGPQWTFSPCLCVARDDRWGRTYESFGEDPKLATKFAEVVEGYEGRPGQLDNPDRVLATAKHFAGDGLTVFGTGEGDYTLDQGVNQVSRKTFEKLALDPFKPAVKKWDVGSVMPSFSSVDWTEDGLGNPLKMHAHDELLNGRLKGDLGFDGFVISDWRAIHQIPGDYRTQVKTSVNAGVDMFMEPYSGNTVGWKEFVTTLVDLVNDGEVTEARLDDAVGRILTAKLELGLFEKPYANRKHIEQVGSKAHRAVAREAVAKSQVLLTNKGSALPLGKGGSKPLYVAGSNADDIGNQAGGWTIQWQGQSGDAIPGDTILDGIRATTNRPVVFSEDASKAVPSNADAVVVVGETPYTEGFGDVGGPQWTDADGTRPAQTMELNAADQAAVKKACDRAATCTVLVVSGRPMVIPAELRSRIDALVASWLPGSEGRGVADVVFGTRKFTGKLPMSWPKTLDQQPINVGDADYDPLFAYGWGLKR